MRLICISDTHNQHDWISIPPGDVLIHAGDISYRGTKDELIRFLDWFSILPHPNKILIAGNHDWGFETKPDEFEKIVTDLGIIYLNDSGVEINGIKFWGSPIQPEFCSWAFNRERTERDAILNGGKFIKEHWDLIPDNTDVLITHGPPYTILDKCPNSVGCHELLKAVEKIKPKVHIFGHIHEGRGRMRVGKTTFINASSLDGKYKPYGTLAEIVDI